MLLVALTLTGYVVVLSLDEAGAFTRGAQSPRYSVTYCVESTPSDVSMSQANTLLANAIAHWHAAPDQDDAQAMSLTRHDPCQSGTDVRIRAASLSTGVLASASSTTITFTTSVSWWDGAGSRESHEYAYEGILAHEMGHTFGLGHSGGGKWTYDGDYTPTMADCVSQGDSAVMDTIQQDEWGGAAYARGGARRYWNANPGFEKDFSHWARSSTSIVVGSAYAITGNRGVKMPSSGNYLYMTTVYDPWVGSGGGQVQSMSTSPSLQVFGFYRHPASGTTGGVKVQYVYRYLRYDSSICKREADANATHTSWSAVTDLKSCGDPGTSWTSCSGSVTISNTSTNDATVFRAYIRSTSSSDVYVDKVGALGGTDP